MRTNLPIASLGSHVRQVSKRNKDKADIEVFSVTNSEGFTRSTDYFSKEVFSKDVSNYKVVRRGQFAYNPSRINVGSIDYLKPAETALVSPLYIVFETNAELYPDYLLRYMKGDWGNAQIRANTEGAVRDSLKYKGLENIKIPLPPLDDQIRIAHLLSKVEGLIAQRKQNLQQLDDLLKSVFVEMFGIRDGTYKRWTIDKLVSHSEIVSGVTKGKKYKTEELIETPYMRVANVQDGRFDLGEIKTISVTQKEIDRYLLKHGDLLLTEGGDPDKLGRGSVWEGQIEICIHQNHIFRVRINTKNEINPFYLSALVGSAYGKAYFLKSAKQTTGIASINSTQLKNFPTVIPPIDHQNQFAIVVKKIEGIKSQYQQSLTELENLYGALSQQAFKGELDLSRIPLNREQPEIQEEKHEDAIAPFEGGLPEHLKVTLANLNAFNLSASNLKAVQEAARFAKLDLPQLNSVMQAAKQLAALRTPLQELQQMEGISQAMEQAQVAIKSLGIEHMESIRKSVELAHSMAANLPKIDFGLLNQHSEALKEATEPFESMRRVMENISMPSRELQESLRLQSETIKRLHGSIPDFTGWQKQVVDPDAVDFDDEEETAKRLFTREDVTAIFAYTVEPLGFDSLLYVLSELETVDFAGYETIKAILFELLGEQQLMQFFDEEQKTLLLRAAP